jgi:hypothetical protein
LNLRPFGSSKILVEDSLKRFFFPIFPTIKAKKMYLKKKPILNEKERDFIIGHCIILSNFFCLVKLINHKHETLWLTKKSHIIHVVYIDFIQSSSSNYWIEINFDLN